MTTQDTMTHTAPLSLMNGDDRILTTDEVAQMLRLKPATLEKARSTGLGNYPPFVRLGRRRVGYLLSAVLAWIAVLLLLGLAVLRRPAAGSTDPDQFARNVRSHVDALVRLLEREGDATTIEIDIDDLDESIVANLDDLLGQIDVALSQLGDMHETLDAVLDANERTERNELGDLTRCNLADPCHWDGKRGTERAVVHLEARQVDNSTAGVGQLEPVAGAAAGHDFRDHQRRLSAGAKSRSGKGHHQGQGWPRAALGGGSAGGGGRIFHGHRCIVRGNELTTDILVTRVKP